MAHTRVTSTCIADSTKPANTSIYAHTRADYSHTPKSKMQSQHIWEDLTKFHVDYPWNIHSKDAQFLHYPHSSRLEYNFLLVSKVWVCASLKTSVVVLPVLARQNSMRPSGISSALIRNNFHISRHSP